MSKETAQERLERERKVGEKKASVVCKWVEVKRGLRGLRGWGADVRCSIKPCEDSVINPLKMSDCR